MASQRPFVVEIPYEVATEDRFVFVPAHKVVPKKLSSYTKREHHIRRRVVKAEIIAWLNHSVGKGNYQIGSPCRDPVPFQFDDKAKAALFKLFFA